MTWFQLTRGRLYGYHLIGNVGLRLSQNPTLLWFECTSIVYKYDNEMQWMERRIWQYENIQIVCKNHLGQKNYIYVDTFLANLFNTASIQTGWKLVACMSKFTVNLCHRHLYTYKSLHVLYDKEEQWKWQSSSGGLFSNYFLN